MEEQRYLYLEIMRQHMQEFYLLDEKQVEEVLPRFLRTLFQYMNQLEVLQQQGDVAALAKASHAVRGTLLNLGLFDLDEYISEVEKQCADPCDLPACHSLLVKLREKLQPLYPVAPACTNLDQEAL